MCDSHGFKKTEGKAVKILDSRRLTGKNFLSPRAGAVAEVRFESGEDAEQAVLAWSASLDRVLTALDWPDVPRWVRLYGDSASLVMDAPIDTLYAATEINEWAIADASGDAVPLTEAIESLRRSLADEVNGALLELQAAAEDRFLTFVWDDDVVSIGAGKSSKSWPMNALPAVDEVPWKELANIPTVYITGTNGKTTTTRMTASILRTAGWRTGCTSSDGVVVDGVEIERGDWTGPGAARRVLRHPDVDVAVLETARGGLLRRGLVVDSCHAALITNIADDHLGEYGIERVEDMARVKGLVCRAVGLQGRRILNADDALLRDLGEQWGAPVVWFSLGPRNAWLDTHLRKGGEAWVLEDGWLCRYQGMTATRVVPVGDIPATHGGAAQHNVANALGAAALTHSLGVDLDTVRQGLCQFEGSLQDNPGRCNLHDYNGIQLLLDFGHNPHGVRAMLTMARGLMVDRQNARLWVSLGQAGDRSDSDLNGLAEAVLESKPDQVSLREVAGYERGRQPGEVTGFLRRVLVENGQSPECIWHHEDEVAALKDALGWARPGDLVVHLVHIQRDAVQTLLNRS